MKHLILTWRRRTERPHAEASAVTRRRVGLTLALVLATVVPTLSYRAQPAIAAVFGETTERIASEEINSTSGLVGSSLSADGRYVVFMDTSGLKLVRRDRQTSETVQVNVNDAGQVANNQSSVPVISGNGRFVAFSSFATNLVPNDTNGVEDVFLRDIQERTTGRVSVTQANEQGNNNSSQPSISANGQFVAFVSYATNLAFGVSSPIQNIFLKNIGTGSIELVSVGIGGSSNGPSAAPAVSDDGKWVVFQSSASNLVVGSATVQDAYLRDITGSSTRRLPTPNGQRIAGSVTISGNGKTVAFVGTSSSAACCLLVYDVQTETTSSVVGSPDAFKQVFGTSLSADGRFLAFASFDALTPEGTQNRWQVYVRDNTMGTIRIASVDSAGQPANSDTGNSSGSFHVSQDGYSVAFISFATNLASTDNNGLTDVFVHTRNQQVSEPPCADSDGNGTPDNDGDGLCDNWEDSGVDSDINGIIDLPLYDVNRNGAISIAERADRDHKDIYVEIDYMASHRPRDDALQRVVEAFADAPIGNPDGTSGIRLHLQVDEEIPHDDTLAFPDCTAFPSGDVANFDTIKEARFATVSERSRGIQVPSAKRFVSHYALFAHDLLGVPGTSGCAEGPGDSFDQPGNDLVITLGGWTRLLFGTIPQHATGTSDAQAGTLMHELGHNLGLTHGGSYSERGINCKPNYLSVMSYSRQFANVPVSNRPLDYSPQALGSLDEKALNEPAGIGGPPQSLTAYGPPPASIVSGDRPINWSRDGDTTDIGVEQDVNRLTDAQPTCGGLGEMLEGFDDWSRLRYNFRESTNFAEGAHVGTSDEITLEEAEALSPDSDVDGVLNLHDDCPFVANPDQSDSDGDGLGDACSGTVPGKATTTTSLPGPGSGTTQQQTEGSASAAPPVNARQPRLALTGANLIRFIAVANLLLCLGGHCILWRRRSAVAS